MAAATLAFDILARDKASKTLKHVGDNADKSGRQLNDFGDKMRSAGSRLGSFAKTAGIAAVGLGGVAVVLGKGLVDAATESQKVTKQTEAVLKSMGPSAGVTAKHVERLTKRLSEQAGIDDELIQSGQNVLLTFGKVQNKIGKGNKIFDRATEAALNMSVALGTDMQGATIQVGKALNDPIKGITALSRAGVSFTQQQKDQITWMVKSGDTLSAQKMILGELEKQFGGSAAAQATAGERLGVIWGNLQEDLGARLLPMFEKAAEWLGQNLPRALDTLGQWLTPLIDQVGLFWGALTTGMTEDEGTPIENVALGIRDAVQAIKQWFDDNGETIKAVVGDVFGTIGDVFDTVKGAAEDVLPKVAEFGRWFFENGPALEVIISGLTVAMGAYAASCIVAAGATLAPIAPLLLAAGAIGVLSWATGEFVDNHLPEFSNAVQWLVDHVLEPLVDTLQDAVHSLEDLLNLMDQVPSLPSAGGGGGGGFIPGLPPGMSDLLPWADDGGVWPGPLGVHSLGWVAGGETVVPTHKPGVSLGGEEVHLHVTQLPGEDQVSAGMRALRHHTEVQMAVGR